MLSETLKKLNKEEAEVLLHAPLYVTVLVAGADFHLTETEIKESLRIIHIKTFSEVGEIQEIFKSLDDHAQDELDQIIDLLPKDYTERNALLIKKLEVLNSIFTKMDNHLAHKYYTTLKRFAYFIARSSPAPTGIGLSTAEKEIIQLNMLIEPNLN